MAQITWLLLSSFEMSQWWIQASVFGLMEEAEAKGSDGKILD